MDPTDRTADDATAARIVLEGAPLRTFGQAATRGVISGFVLGCTGISVFASGLRACAPPDAPGWEQAGQLQFNAARDSFRRGTQDRTAQLGEAASLLNVQPRTTANRERSKTLLHGLIDSGLPDASTLAAHYLLGRIALAHEPQPRLDTARTHFTAVVAHDPNQPYAALAGAQLVLLALAGSGEIIQRVDEAELHALRLPPGGIRAAVFFVMAQFVLDAQAGPQRALGFLRRSLEDGLATPGARADALVAAAQLAANHDTLASTDWREAFLREFPRDPRAARLRSLSSPTPP